MGKDRILARLADNPHRRLVEDTVAEMGWWACFREDRAKKKPATQPDSRLTPAALLSDQEGNAEDGQERTMSLRQRQKIQEVLRRVNA